MDIQQCGRFITLLRKEQELTQKQLAQKIGVTDKAISRWETGKGLPDASSLLALSELFSVTVNELLAGDRVAPSHTVQAAENTVLGVLRMRDCEVKKSKRRGRILALIAAIVCTLLLGAAVYDVFCLNGITPTTIYETCRARTLAAQIVSGDYERAAPTVGFINKDRQTEQAAWVLRMEALAKTVYIETIQVDRLVKDDGFICGDVLLIAVDRASGNRYMFRSRMAQQDGLVFGGVTCCAGDSVLGKVLEERITAALCTWDAG